jgi:pimeloyl-ACP methyl ester carboxylesterase
MTMAIDERGLSRRDLLRLGAVAGGSVLAGSLVGCVRSRPGAGDEAQKLNQEASLKETSMTVTTEKSVGTAISPFRVNVPQADLDDLRARIAATRFPDKELVEDQSQGVQLATVQALARYWETEYDWRKCEARLNAVPQFITEIDGLDIHFVHVRSKHEDALPLIVTHGWPGSFIEQMKIVDLLTDPTDHGGSASDAFHVVIPNMPGYGFSGKPTTTGWDPARIGRAWVTLMKRLGYGKFVASGGDWGGVVMEVMAGGRDAPASPAPPPPELLGIHTNFPGVVPPDIDKAIQTGAALPSDLSAEERRATEQLAFLYGHVAYGAMMGSRPQTLYGLADSPVALAAFMLDHDAASYEMITRAFNGKKEGLTRDDVLDNLTLFWLTNTGVSAARLYWEYLYSYKGSYLAVKNVSVPVAVSVFPNEVYQAPRSWAVQAYPNLVYFNEVDRGGHFAAWEQPELYASELRAGFRSLR